MSSPIIQPSFAAGEIAPHLRGRVDLAKYKAGVAVARNFFVDYRGGLSTRPGSSFVGVARDQSSSPRLIPFKFSTGQAYHLVIDSAFGLRIVADGGFVTEAPFAVSALLSPIGPTFNIPGNNYAPGDDVFFAGSVGLARPNGVSGINGRVLRVTAVAGAAVSCVDQINGRVDATAWTAYVGGLTASRIYTVAVPWAAVDLRRLKFTQSADVLTVTHVNYPTFEVRRFGATDWQIARLIIGTSMSAPASQVATPLNVPTGTDPAPALFFFAYAVTAVNTKTGEESNATISCTCVNGALDQATGVVNQLAYSAVPGADAYNIYGAQQVVNGTQPAPPYFWGFIGRSSGTSFTDNNYTRDFTTGPPTNEDPFQSGQLSSAVVDQAGFGYLDPAVQIFDSSGSGGIITPTRAGDGSIASLAVAQPGVNYAAPRLVIVEQDTTLGTGLTVAFDGTWQASGGGFVPGLGSVTITNGGAGYHIPYVTAQPQLSGVDYGVPGVYYAQVVGGILTLVTLQAPFAPTSAGVTMTFTAVDTLPGAVVAGSQATAHPILSAQDNPGVVAYFDQRRVLGATASNPDTLWMTRPGLFSNFDTSFPSQDSDAITATILSNEVNAIASLTAMASGLIALTSDGAWQVSGGSPGAALTPVDITAQAQAFSGATDIQPLKIVYDLIYVPARGWGVRDLSYNFYVNVYTGQDVSALASHLLTGRQILQWAYAEQPFYFVPIVLDDGVMLAFTYLKEQEVYGWARWDTYGLYCDVSVVPEGTEDVPYIVVRRFLNGQWFYLIERQASRFFDGDPSLSAPSLPEGAWCLDCAVEYALGFPDATLTQSGAPSGNDWTFVADVPLFSAANLGDVLRVGNGIGTVTQVVTTSAIVASMSTAPTKLVQNARTLFLPPAAPGAWSLTPPVTVIGGLDHLNGQMAGILADGTPVAPQVVVDGCVTLPEAASRILAGLQYTCQMQTLPPDIGDPTIQGRRKMVPAVTIRHVETRGLFVGPAFDDMVNFKERSDEVWDNPTNLQSGGGQITDTLIAGGVYMQKPIEDRDRRAVVQTVWTEDGSICIAQPWPLPATITATIIEIEVGDDPEQ